MSTDNAGASGLGKLSASLRRRLGERGFKILKGVPLGLATGFTLAELAGDVYGLAMDPRRQKVKRNLDEFEFESDVSSGFRLKVEDQILADMLGTGIGQTSMNRQFEASEQARQEAELMDQVNRERDRLYSVAVQTPPTMAETLARLGVGMR